MRAIALLLCATLTSTDAYCVKEENICDGEGPAFRPLPNCQEYVHCVDGAVAAVVPCSDGSIFDELLGRCNWDYVSFCVVESCPPTELPTSMPSFSPTSYPSGSPSPPPSGSPSSSPTASPSSMPSSRPSTSPSDPPTFIYDYFKDLETKSMKQKMEAIVLQSRNPAGIASPSTKYSYQGLIDALREMSLDGIASGGRTFQFWIAQQSQRYDYGRTNLAAFLAMAMTESIAYDTCDEFNLEEVAGKYALSNACGQNLRSYQDEACTRSDEADMSCPVDANMEVTSSGFAAAVQGRAPPPFSCRPKAHSGDYAGYWDSITGLSSKTAYANAK